MPALDPCFAAEGPAGWNPPRHTVRLPVFRDLNVLESLAFHGALFRDFGENVADAFFDDDGVCFAIDSFGGNGVRDLDDPDARGLHLGFYRYTVIPLYRESPRWSSESNISLLARSHVDLE